MEDFMAHSNWIELTLRKQGHKDVFCFAGEKVYIKAPNEEMVPPLLTGTFGGSDAMHSSVPSLCRYLS